MLKNKIKRLVKRFRVKFYRWEKGASWFKVPSDSTGYENICKAICRKMINHPDSKFTIAPLAHKRYIINKQLDIFIIIVDSKIEITNHVYHYVINLGERDVNKIIEHFDNKVDRIRVQYEEEIKSQIENTLHSIYDKITNSQNT